MQAHILKLEDHSQWVKFIKNHPLATIHQHPSWGQFQAKVPSRGKYWIVALKKDDKIIGGSLIIRHLLPKGFSWLYAARGPLIDFQGNNAPEQIAAIKKSLKSIAKREKSIFLRIDPPLDKNIHKNPPKFKGFHEVSYDFQPKHTLILDISQPEEKILAQMKPKGRYNIKVAKKKGVEIVKADPSKPEKFQEQINEFYNIFQETTQRDGFSGHDANYYKNMVETLASKHLATLYLAKFEGQIIAGLIATFFNDTATYYFGASSNKHRNVMAPYLLQWQAIQDAKSSHKYYDFLGIAGSDNPKDPWHGITQFKKKFGGKMISYHKAQETAFKPVLHLLYRLYKRLR